MPAIGFLDYVDGRYEASIEDLEEFPHEASDLDDLYQPKAMLEGITYLAMNDGARARGACESARQHLEKEIAEVPRDARKRASMGLTLACLGRKEEAIREARLAADLKPVSVDALDGPSYQDNLARVYAMVGEPDAACDILEKLLSHSSGAAVNLLRLDPIWVPLRTFPRFRNIIGS